METLEGKNDLRSVEPGPILGELGLFTKVEEEFSAIEEVNHEVESLRCLECVV